MLLIAALAPWSAHGRAVIERRELRPMRTGSKSNALAEPGVHYAARRS